MGFLAELRRRNVFRAGTFYAAFAWLVVQIATQVFPFFGIPNWVVRWIVLAAVIGFPFVLAFAWYYELTPDGIKRESKVGPSESIRHLTARRLDRGIIAALSLAVVLLLANTFILHRDTVAIPDKSVAVLPLINASGNAGEQYFSDGLSEELISDLTQITGLKVIGRNSSFQFRNSKLDSAAIGARLGVATLLEGTVRRQDSRVRIVIGLIRASDGSSLWSRTYDRDMKDIFDVQSDISREVAAALQVELLGGKQPPSMPSNRDPVAHSALLEGNYYFERHTADDYARAIGYYDTAIRVDNAYALAYARRSVARVYLAASFLGSDKASEDFAMARRDANTALSLDPKLVEGHLALGWVMEYADLDLTGAEAEYRRALALAPDSAIAARRLGGILADLGQLDEAVAMTHKVTVSEPLVSANFFNLALYLTALDRYEDAVKAVDSAIDLQPTSAGFHMQLAIIAVLRGDATTAARQAALEPPGPWRDLAVTLSRQVGGDQAMADAAVNGLIAQHSAEMPFQIAEVYALRRQPDQMFEWLDRAWIARDPGITGLLYDPFLLKYRDDPRFVAFCGKVGLPTPPATKTSAGA